jgi:hypothetical protein
MKNRIIGGLALAVGLALLMAGTAVAISHYATTNQLTSISYSTKSNQTHFVGTLSSDQSACTVGRRVKVYRVNAIGRIVVAVTHSDDVGDYDARLQGNLPAGDYFTKATRSDNGTFTCHANRSKIITVSHTN